jgi:hypothetical protein
MAGNNLTELMTVFTLTGFASQSELQLSFLGISLHLFLQYHGEY